MSESVNPLANFFNRFRKPSKPEQPPPLPTEEEDLNPLKRVLGLIGTEGNLGTLGHALLDLSAVLTAGTVLHAEVDRLRQKWHRDTQEGSSPQRAVGEVEVFQKSLEILARLEKPGKTWLTKHPTMDHIFYGPYGVFQINFFFEDNKPDMTLVTKDQKIQANFDQLKSTV